MTVPDLHTVINSSSWNSLFSTPEQLVQNMDRFEELGTFTTIVDAGSLTAAADRLEVAKSAVSRRLKDLEARLGVQLLQRTTRQPETRALTYSLDDHQKELRHDRPHRTE